MSGAEHQTIEGRGILRERLQPNLMFWGYHMDTSGVIFSLKFLFENGILHMLDVHFL